jgi:hypothetical protein
MTAKEKKWFWMVNYCQKRKLPPAQKWAWEEAEREYAHRH